MLARITRSLIAITLGLFLAEPIFGQTHILSPTSTSGVPGASVSVPVLLDNSEPARGFSLGLAHTGSILTLTAITEGAALLASNGGAGPDFYFEDINPANGPGGTCGTVLSFAAPLDDIPVGPGSELVIYEYTISAAAEPGTSEALTVVDTLGSPPLETIVSIAGVTRIPISTPADVSVETPAVASLSCTLFDPCACVFDLAWTNGGVYDSIEIREDGVLVETLPGTATATQLSVGMTTIGGPESATFSVNGVRNGVTGGAANCLADCPDVPDPIEPSGLTCTVDHLAGTATLTWTNGQPYRSLDISVEGGGTQVLPGIVSSTTVNLPSPGIYELCLDGSDECGVPFATVCCMVELEQVFQRGDMNIDGGYNISDPIYGLNYLFGGGPMDCLKAADINDSGDVNIADIIAALQGIFGTGAPPEAPFAACGIDPTPDPLSCDSFPICP